MSKTLRLPGCWPVVFDFSTSHWKRDGTHHGPQSNPIVAILRRIHLDSERSPSEGWRWWFYARGGYALHLDLWIDRREVAHREVYWVKWTHNDTWGLAQFDEACGPFATKTGWWLFGHSEPLHGTPAVIGPRVKVPR